VIVLQDRFRVSLTWVTSPVFGLGCEITAAVRDQLLLQPVFRVPVLAFRHSVFVGDASVVAGGHHAEVGAELTAAADVSPA